MRVAFDQERLISHAGLLLTMTLADWLGSGSRFARRTGRNAEEPREISVIGEHKKGPADA